MRPASKILIFLIIVIIAAGVISLCFDQIKSLVYHCIAKISKRRGEKPGIMMPHEKKPKKKEPEVLEISTEQPVLAPDEWHAAVLIPQPISEIELRDVY